MYKNKINNVQELDEEVEKSEKILTTSFNQSTPFTVGETLTSGTCEQR